MDKTALLKKIRALAKHGVGGRGRERRKATRSHDEEIRHFGGGARRGDSHPPRLHISRRGGKENPQASGLQGHGGYTYELVYTASGRKVRTQLGADCTPAEKVEIEYLFDFYKRLWEKEKDAFLAAYIQKHRIFAIRADVEPREMSLEESIKMSALMRGMSDESPLRAIEAGK